MATSLARAQSVTISVVGGGAGANGGGANGGEAALTSSAAPPTAQQAFASSLGAQVALQLDDGWASTSGSEGLLFIHGVNHSLKDSLKRFAQLLALGQFPRHIKPFVFSW